MAQLPVVRSVGGTAFDSRRGCAESNCAYRYVLNGSMKLEEALASFIKYINFECGTQACVAAHPSAECIDAHQDP